MEFFKKAAARHSSNTTAERALSYVTYATAGSLEQQLSTAAKADAQAVLKRGGGLAGARTRCLPDRMHCVARQVLDRLSPARRAALPMMPHLRCIVTHQPSSWW